MVIIDKVSRDFQNGRVKVLNNVSFAIRGGESVGIIGKNGVGKTTLLKLIVGLLSPSSGNVWTLGKNPCETIDYLRPEIGCLFSGNSSLLSADSVRAILEKQKTVYHIPEEKYKEILSSIGEMLELENYYERPFSKLSTGQKRCVELIATVLPMPKLLILDEPTIGLDEENKERFCKIVHSLQKDYGMTIIISSHDLDSLSVSCNRVLVLQDGSLTFDGDWQSLKEKGSIWRRASFISPTFIDMEDLPIKHMTYENNKMEIVFKLSQLTVDGLRSFLEERGEIRDFYVEEPPIETLVCSILRGGDCA